MAHHIIDRQTNDGFEELGIEVTMVGNGWHWKEAPKGDYDQTLFPTEKAAVEAAAFTLNGVHSNKCPCF